MLYECNCVHKHNELKSILMDTIYLCFELCMYYTDCVQDIHSQRLIPLRVMGPATSWVRYRRDWTSFRPYLKNEKGLWSLIGKCILRTEPIRLLARKGILLRRELFVYQLFDFSWVNVLANKKMSWGERKLCAEYRSQSCKVLCVLVDVDRSC